MLKHLLTLAALATATLGANADTLDLSLSDLGSGWGDSSYDAATQTITYVADWTGRGWWLGDVDYSQWDQVVIEVEPCSCTTKMVVEYAEEGAASSEVTVAAGAEKLVCELDAAYKAHVKQIYLQSAAAGTLTLKAAYLENGVEVDPNLLWEGEYEIKGWNNGAEFSASKVEAGDIIEYTFTSAGAAGSQVLVKGSNWANLLGTTKISTADMETGAVQVGVTQEMLDKCGGKIFLQGDGGCVVTKVAKVGTFDSKGVIAYGSRIPGVQVFATIPAGTKQLAVEFDGTPDWAQFCNSSWTDLELESTVSEDGKTRIYNLTDEVIEAVNSKETPEFIINGGGANVVSIYVYDPLSGVETIGAVEAEGPVDVFTVAGQRVKANVLPTEATIGLTPGLYIVGKKKVLVK